MVKTIVTPLHYRQWKAKYRKPDNTFGMTRSFFALKHGEPQKYLFTERKKNALDNQNHRERQ